MESTTRRRSDDARNQRTTSATTAQQYSTTAPRLTTQIRARRVQSDRTEMNLTELKSRFSSVASEKCANKTLRPSLSTKALLVWNTGRLSKTFLQITGARTTVTGSSVYFIAQSQLTSFRLLYTRLKTANSTEIIATESCNKNVSAHRKNEIVNVCVAHDKNRSTCKRKRAWLHRTNTILALGLAQQRFHRYAVQAYTGSSWILLNVSITRRIQSLAVTRSFPYSTSPVIAFYTTFPVLDIFNDRHYLHFYSRIPLPDVLITRRFSVSNKSMPSPSEVGTCRDINCFACYSIIALN